MTWQPAETAPRNKTILADVGLPWAVVAHWSDVGNLWIYPNIQCDLFQGKWNDYYYENEYVDVLIGWMEMPEVEE